MQIFKNYHIKNIYLNPSNSFSMTPKERTFRADLIVALTLCMV